MELLAGSLIVIGHNVFHVLPNEVPVLFFLGLISLQLRNGSWRAAGFRRPDSWRRTVLIAVCAAALLQLKSLVTEPIGDLIWHHPPQISQVFQGIGGVKDALQGLGIVWTFAALGEELAYRGYLLQRAAEVGN